MNIKEKENFLMNTYCENPYERHEMRKWMQEKGVDKVYEIVMELFYSDEEDV